MAGRALGCLPYLNLKPLIRSLEHCTPPGYRLVYDTPSGLARMLREGSCDIAAVSSLEALANPELVILPDFAIASHGRVSSVLLFSRVPFAQIESVALDTSSLSGAALTRILLEELYGCRPQYLHAAPCPQRMLQDADACLLIGNPAMTQAPCVPHVLDLGEGWQRLTSLPFMFGVWAARQGAVDDDDVALLRRARQEGLQQVEAIAREEAPRLGLSEAVIRNYLAEIMVYTLGPAEMAGLREFHLRAQAHGLLGPDSGVRLYGQQSDSLLPGSPRA